MEVDSVLNLLDGIDGEVQESIEIWYTGHEGNLQSHAEACATPTLWTPWIPRVFFGRPHMEELIFQALPDVEIEMTSSSLGVLACGPGGMLDDCRFVVERMVLSATARIHYVEEASTT